jgi:hypothetical protein
MKKVTPQYYFNLDIMVHTCNSSLGRLRQEIFELKSSLGYIVRLFLKTSKHVSKQTNNKGKSQR